MYFATNKDDAFTTLVYNVRYMMRHVTEALTEGKNSVPAMLNESPTNWASTLGWRVEGWAENSAILEQLHHVARYLADETQDAYISVLSDPQSDAPSEMEEEFDARLNAIAEKAVRWIAAEQMRIIMRGPESSSNPMTMVISAAKIKAAKRMLEVLGLSDNIFTTGTAIDDLLTARAERKREQEELRHEQRQITPDKVVLVKVGNAYSLDAYNKNGTFMERKTLSASRKPDALAVARQWAEELRTQALAEAKKRGWETENGYDRFALSTPTVEA